MTQSPPKKKFRQASLMDLFSPKSKKDKPVNLNEEDNGMSDTNKMERDHRLKENCVLDKNEQQEISQSDCDSEISQKIDDERYTKSKPKNEHCIIEIDLISDSSSDSRPGTGKNGPEEMLNSSSHKEFQSSNSPKKSPKKSFMKTTPKKSPKKTYGNFSQKDTNTMASGSGINVRKLAAAAAEKRFRKKDSNLVQTSKEKVLRDHSPDMFEEDIQQEKISWLGSPLSSLSFINNSNLNVPRVTPSPNHSVLIRLPLSSTLDMPPEPYPRKYTDAWNTHHVRLPCSPQNVYPVPQGDGTNKIVKRWSVVCSALQDEIKDVKHLQSAILKYNSRYANKWNFRGLFTLFEEEFEEEESDYFFSHTLPSMVRLAISLPDLLTAPLPLLTAKATHSITLSQLQIGSLLANAFFCTFPRRNAKGHDTEYGNYPDINFNRLFSYDMPNSLAKLKCVINYFRRITVKPPVGCVTFTRQFMYGELLPQWTLSSQPLPRLHVDSEGLIEETQGFLQVDFANKFLGGGVLGLGCVQEEIRFILCPELILSRLFTHYLEKSEALIITGVEQFNLGRGYASSFRWSGSYNDNTPMDPWRRRICQVTAIDALQFTNNPHQQYAPSLIRRELNKAFAGYRLLDTSPGIAAAVATGNWGCGAFRGDVRLKALIQLAVCGQVGRDMAYFTFGNTQIRDELFDIHTFLTENKVTVGELSQVLEQYHTSKEEVDGTDLVHYIYHNLAAYNSDTDDDGDDNDRDVHMQQSESKDMKTEKEESKCENDMEVIKKTSRNISDYFLKKPNKTKSSISSQSSATINTEDSLTDDKILQVLTECDRLVEGQKKTAEADKRNKNKESTKDEIMETDEESNS
ncbi:unnamed protein product, partial [Meganyctiphanes norvegica]